MRINKIIQVLKTNQYFLSGARYGFAAAIFSILAFFLLLLLGENPLIANKYLDFLLIPLFVFVAVKEVRDYRNAGQLHFWEGMTTGFFAYFLCSIISAGFIWIYLAIDQHLVEEYIQHSIRIMMDKKEGIVEQMGIETFKNGLNNVKGIRTFDLAADDFLRKIIIGFGINVVISVAMRRTYIK